MTTIELYNKDVLGADMKTLRKKVERQRIALEKIESWLVCAGITSADDMAQSFELMLDITQKALTQTNNE